MTNDRRPHSRSLLFRADPERQARLRAAAEIYVPTTRGQFVHRAVQEAAIRGAWDHRSARDVAKELAPGDLPIPYRQSLVGAMRGAIGAYRKHFLRKGWTLVGVEVPVGGVYLDMVWEIRAGLVVDELKLGGSYREGVPVDDLAQVRDQCTKAKAAWGEEFLGVRLLPLMFPGAYRWVPRS